MIEASRQLLPTELGILVVRSADREANCSFFVVPDRVNCIEELSFREMHIAGRKVINIPNPGKSLG
jgi:hypothetical protein